MRLPICCRVFGSISWGCAFCSTCCISVMITVVAMPLATSPALYPPMPSASTTTPFAASEATESSLCERTMPGSVLLTISRVCVRSIFLELYVHAVCRLRSRGGACAGRRGHAGAQRTGEFHAVAETVFRILGQRAVQKGRKARRHVGVDGKNVDGR